MSSDQPPPQGRRSVRRFIEMKRSGERIVSLTAYDYLMARLLERAGVDLILVGDSLGQVVLGYETTLPVTLDEMLHHARAVRRGAPGTPVVIDLPFLTYQVSARQALKNAGRALKDTGVDAVKIEGGTPRVCKTVRRLVEAGIPVMGHVGLTPQSVNLLGYRVQGRGEEAAKALRVQAEALQAAGCFSLVLELVPAALASDISKSLEIPTIGIGAGPGCDGQVLVVSDALGMNSEFRPRFLKRFAALDEVVSEAVTAYSAEVRTGSYPGPEHSFSQDG